MRHLLPSSAALLLAIAVAQPGSAKDALPAAPAKPFELARMARAASPGLHIKLVDETGAPVYPVPVAVEYDSGAPVKAQVTEAGLTVPAAEGRNIRAITLGSQSPQRFDVDTTRANFLVFRR
jgi:hypothetical protein